jgi:hypothetical protein
MGSSLLQMSPTECLNKLKKPPYVMRKGPSCRKEELPRSIPAAVVGGGGGDCGDGGCGSSGS